MTNGKTVKPILSLEKALRIIEIMAQEAKPMRLMDIAAAAELPTSTALRLLNTLQTNGYVMQDISTARYSLSLKLFQLGNQVAAGISTVAVARPFLTELAAKTGRSVNLAIPHGTAATIVDVTNGFYEDELIITRPGRIIPLYCSAIGRALLLDYTPEQMDQYLQSTALVPFTPLTTTTRDGLLEKLSASRVCGFTYDPGELRAGIAGVGAPIRSNGRIVAAISVAELNSVLTQETIRALGTDILQTAQQISNCLQ